MRHTLLSLATCLALVAPPALADPCSSRGVNAHLPSPADLVAIRDAGFGWVRFDFNWKDMEPSKGQLQWGPWDQAVDAAVANGLSVFGTIAYTPKWAAEDPACVDCGPVPFAKVGDWTDFVSAVVKRYKGKVRHWGMWNEPNLKGFYLGTAERYVGDVLIPGAAAVKAANPDALVLGPELAGLTKSSDWSGDEGQCLLGQCIFNGWEVDLAKVLAAGGGSIDIVTHHFYKDDAAGIYQAILDGEEDFGFATHSALRQVVDAHAPGKPVWLTEWGWETAGYGAYAEKKGDSEAEQAAKVVGVFGGLAQVREGTWAGSENDPWPALEKLFVYDWHDGAVDGVLWSYGLVRDDGSPKPVVAALKASFAAHPESCEAPDPVAPTPRIEAKSAEAPLVEGAADGDIAEWTDAVLPILLTPPADWVALGGGAPVSAMDAGARLYLGWAPGRLRVAVEVTDDAHVVVDDPELLWTGDSLQIALDPDHGHTVGYAPDDWEVTLAHGDGALVTCFHAPPVGCAVAAGTRRVGGSTLYEVDIPHDTAATTVGLSILVNENDGAGREGWLEWTPGIGLEKDPSRFATVTLTGGAPPPGDAGGGADAGGPPAGEDAGPSAPGDPDAADTVTGGAATTDTGTVAGEPDLGSPGPSGPGFSAATDAAPAPADPAGSDEGCSGSPGPLPALLLALAIRRRCRWRRGRRRGGGPPAGSR